MMGVTCYQEQVLLIQLIPLFKPIFHPAITLIHLNCILSWAGWVFEANDLSLSSKSIIAAASKTSTNL